MSADDLATLGTSLGMGSKLDNTQSMKFNPTTTAAGGNAQTATTALAYPGIAQASFASQCFNRRINWRKWFSK
jgi:hypothetical protein